jgi:hypothetical protein
VRNGTGSIKTTDHCGLKLRFAPGSVERKYRTLANCPQADINAVTRLGALGER